MSVSREAQPIVAQPERRHITDLKRVARRLHRNDRVATVLLWGIGGFVALLFIGIIIKLLVDGMPALVKPSFFLGTDDADIAKQIFNTFYLLILTEAFLFPIALAAAIYLVEYAPQGKLVATIHFAAETLAGVPSLVLGMFGFLVFGIYMQLGISRLSGALTLLCLNFPLALRLFEEALSSVPRELREAGLAMGASKWYVIRTVVLPSAVPGIITGLILTAGKIIGESAALLFTMGTFSPANVFTLNPLIGSDTLTTRLYYVKGPGAGQTGLEPMQETALAAGIAAVLIVVLFVINIGARALGRALQKKWTAA
ncbi:phosphate transport system permease protein [Thermosporothrix hazakensis]|jgi:phosphate transport system permease protein|uniref:Phosphate transport system permease protein PstA n=2 Tax=Thermosporothrix TaxID=768650 RepID=A0A326TRD3_THEHA|nr:phosphate ABC transporter permease PstA [Thermosporothrix hazakensis]PZW19207.1 phosphate transport system permease protein [Thermosporothrix hazakensis]BBH89709.1 phosphate transport system permease protein PstA [Thermosporothrix sp. COM3]GCE47896.1 phosphate transport system permease protein PstA [Thermosporothrix hazakensis]